MFLSFDEPRVLPLERPSIKLPLELKQMGTPENCGHRSGWRYVGDYLKAAHDSGGMLLDDFVERTFQPGEGARPWTEPWVGIFHHPPNLPAWLDESACCDVFMATPAFRDSLPELRGAVALSEYLGHWLEAKLGVPTLVIKHPSEVPNRKFSLEEWRSCKQKKICQVGWYGRNYRSIYQVQVPVGFEKIHLLQDRPWVLGAHKRIDDYSPYRNREDHGQVTVLTRLPDPDYDELLATSLVYCEYFDVSASNTIVECIARNTPMIANRHPAVIEYLGVGYPLLYDDISQVAGFLMDTQRIDAAFQWISSLDKSWLDVHFFGNKLSDFVLDVMPAESK